MADDALRQTERALVAAPADLDLRRRHARLLARAGQADRALEALDLAWRLGADELFDELQAALAWRAVHAGPVELRFVPAGPFVMGSDVHDHDAAPAHLVELSAFWISAGPLTQAVYRGTPRWSRWMEGHGFAAQPVRALRLADARELLDGLPPPPGVAGRYALPTEAEWERACRASLLRRDGRSPYGVERVPGLLEWTADRYAPDAYAHAAPRDPAGPAEGALRCVRGVALPPPLDVVYREACSEGGDFEVLGPRGGKRVVRHEDGIGVRVVFRAGPA